MGHELSRLEQQIRAKGVERLDPSYNDQFHRAPEDSRAAEFALSFYELAQELPALLGQDRGKHRVQVDARFHFGLPGIRIGQHRIEVKAVAGQVEVRCYEYQPDEANRYRPIHAPRLGLDEVISMNHVDAKVALEKQLNLLDRFLQVTVNLEVRGRSGHPNPAPLGLRE